MNTKIYEDHIYHAGGVLTLAELRKYVADIEELTPKWTVDKYGRTYTYGTKNNHIASITVSRNGWHTWLNSKNSVLCESRILAYEYIREHIKDIPEFVMQRPCWNYYSSTGCWQLDANIAIHPHIKEISGNLPTTLETLQEIMKVANLVCAD